MSGAQWVVVRTMPLVLHPQASMQISPNLTRNNNAFHSISGHMLHWIRDNEINVWMYYSTNLMKTVSIMHDIHVHDTQWHYGEMTFLWAACGKVNVYSTINKCTNSFSSLTWLWKLLCCVILARWRVYQTTAVCSMHSQIHICVEMWSVDSCRCHAAVFFRWWKLNVIDSLPWSASSTIANTLTSTPCKFEIWPFYRTHR